MKKKHAFTLLEIVLCVTLLGLVAGAIGYQAYGLYVQHALEQTGRKLVIQLKELQSLALSYQTDMYLELHEDKGNYVCTCYTDEPLPFLTKESITFPNNFFIKFNKEKKNKLLFHVLSSGRIEPCGVLTLHQNDKIRPFAIDLQYPLQIK